MQPWSRRKPFPYDLMIERSGSTPVGVRLKPSQDGQMVGEPVRRTPSVSPTTYDYGSMDPFKERPFVFGPLTGGVGESEQRTQTPTQYKFGRKIDCSIGGQRRSGPSFTQDVLGSGIVNQIENGEHAGETTVFALVGSAVYVYDGGWVLSKAMGAAALQGVQFQGSAGSDRFWVTNDDGELWGYDGSAWAQATLPAGFKAYYVEKVGTELHLFGEQTSGTVGVNVLRVCTGGDPLLVGSWGGPIYVGDYGKRATWVRAIGTAVYYFKEDGIFTINTDGPSVRVNDLFPQFRNVTAPHYGRNAAPWNDHLWFQFGDGFWRLDGDGNLDPIGPERILGLDNRLRRPGVCFAGHGTWFGYLVTEATDLMKFGEWVNPGQSDEFADAWNGSLADWNDKTATFVYVTSALDGTPWLLIGFNDGSIERTALPQYSPDPADDPRCQFVTGASGEESYLEWPDHHGNAEADDKHWRGFVATGPHLSATDYVTVSYRVDDPDGAWVELGTDLTTSGTKATTPGDVAGRKIQVKENLHGTRTSTPKVESVVLLEQTRPATEMEYGCRALAKHHTARRDGVVDRRTAEQIRQALKNTAGPGPTTIWFPDGSNLSVDFVSVGEVLPNPNARYGVEWEIPLTFVQWTTNTVYGTWARAAVHTWGELAAYRWGQVPGL